MVWEGGRGLGGWRGRGARGLGGWRLWAGKWCWTARSGRSVFLREWGGRGWKEGAGRGAVVASSNDGGGVSDEGIGVGRRVAWPTSKRRADGLVQTTLRFRCLLLLCERTGAGVRDCDLLVKLRCPLQHLSRDVLVALARSHSRSPLAQSHSPSSVFSAPRLANPQSAEPRRRPPSTTSLKRTLRRRSPSLLVRSRLRMQVVNGCWRVLGGTNSTHT